MKLTPKYEDVCFSREQINHIRCVLNLPTFFSAYLVSGLIQDFVERCINAEQSRDAIGSAQLLKRKIVSIRSNSRELARLLSNEVAGEYLVRDPVVYAGECEDFSSDEDIDEKYKFKLKDLIKELGLISVNAEHLLSSNGNIVREYGLLPGMFAGGGAQSGFLWPQLFRIWVRCGKATSKKEGSPLHLFVKFIHESVADHFDLGEVSINTMKEVLTKWEKVGRAAALKEEPPFWLVLADEPWWWMPVED